MKAAPGPAWRQRFAPGKAPLRPAGDANGGGQALAPMLTAGTAVVTASSRGSAALAPMGLLALPVFPAAVLPPPAGSGGAGLPVQVIIQTGPLPPLTVLAAPGFSGGSGLLPRVPLAPPASVPPAGGGGALMPCSVIFSLPAPALQPLGAWQKDVEGWAIAREQQVHVQALWQYGELVMFALLWHPMDFEAGFARRCFRCWQGNADAAGFQTPEAAIAAAYGQGNQYECPVCYNSTFSLPEGAELPGLRALIVRPAMFTEFDRTQTRQQRGIFNSAALDVESTPDFRVRNGDYLFRSDGTRYQLKTPRRMTLRTGFTTPWQATSGITYNLSQASLEDPLTVAYRIPPPDLKLRQVLGSYTRVPVAYGWAETVNAPLIPEEAASPASSGKLQPDVTFPLPGGIS